MFSVTYVCSSQTLMKRRATIISERRMCVRCVLYVDDNSTWTIYLDEQEQGGM